MFEKIQNLMGMRPAEYDKRQVLCPNASSLGFGQWKARVGDFIEYRQGDTISLARMIGRVRYSAGWTNGNPELAAEPVKGFILALVLNPFGNSAMIRWINPADVLRIERPDKGKALFAELFFSERLPFNLNETVRLSKHGTLCDRYYTLEHALQVIKTQNERLQTAGIKFENI